MSFPPFIGHAKPHQNGPDPLKQILRKMTRKPLYCHLKEWCDAHLDILRVEGVDKEYPIDHVLRRPVRLDPSDSDLVNLLEQIPHSEERKGFMRILMLGLCYVVERSRIYTACSVERHVASSCSSYIRYLREIRKYPKEQRGPRVQSVLPPYTVISRHASANKRD